MPRSNGVGRGFALVLLAILLVVLVCGVAIDHALHSGRTGIDGSSSHTSTLTHGPRPSMRAALTTRALPETSQSALPNGSEPRSTTSDLTIQSVAGGVPIEGAAVWLLD